MITTLIRLTQKICEKAVDSYPSTIKFVPQCFMTQEIYDKQLRCFFVFDSIPDWYETQEICKSYFWRSLFNSILPW